MIKNYRLLSGPQFMGKGTFDDSTQKDFPISIRKTWKIPGILILLTSIFTSHVFANAPFPTNPPLPTRFTVSGTVKDKKSGEVLIGATVFLLEVSKSTTNSNGYGFFSISAPSDSYTLVTSFAGYQTDTMKIRLDQNISAVVELSPKATDLEAVVVSSKRRNENVVRPLTGVQKLSVSDIKNVPVIFGEKDVLKTIQLLPGVKSAGDGNSGFYVRGGGADQNLILLDEATVYNPTHFLGFFSAFNSDAIKDLTLYKGAMPAEYGGRLSSVVDIKMNDGNNKDYHVSGGLGLIASRLAVEGPIVKDKGSFIVSARRTYADLFLKLSRDTTINQNSLYFYDLNVKANYAFNKNNRVYLSGYFGKDVFGVAGQFGFDYGNSTATVRWNHIFNSRLFSNTSFIYSNYNYNISITSNGSDLLLKSKIEDVSLKQDFQYFVNSRSKLDFGFQVTHHIISPAVLNASPGSNYNPIDIQKNYSFENAVYISHEYAASDKLRFNYGLRFSSFLETGPGTFNTYDSSGNIKLSKTYESGQIVSSYYNLEPRFSASFQMNENSSVKASYTRNVQNLHLLSNSATSNPTDLWIPSSQNVQPEIADQVSLGYYRNFNDNNYEFSSEVYYKIMQNTIDYKNGAQLQANANVESQLLFGHGRAYGLELFLKKKTGRFTGWISYTLSKTEIQINGINNDDWYPAKQDQTNNIALVGIYQLNKKWTFSANFVYNTGTPATFPSGKYEVNGQTTFYYTERNAYRMPDYNRLDIAATVQGKKHEKWQGSWTFSLYNAYGRENAYAITFRDNPDNATQTQAVQLSLFRWVPSVTYNFKF